VNRPTQDVEAFEFRMHDPVTDEWFHYRESSWEAFERILLSVSQHRGHPMELWALSVYDSDPMEPETPWMEEGRFLYPWKRIARVEHSGIDWQPSMNGADEPVSLGAAKKRRVKPTQMKLAKAERIAKEVEEWLAPYSDFIMVVGSVRRQAPVVGDIEFVILPRDLEELLGIVSEEGFHGGERKQMGVIDKMPIELYIAHERNELGGLVFHATGDFQWNIAMRSIAQRRGLKLNQYGIWRGEKAVLQSEDEKDFFKFLRVRYHEPEERSLARRVKPKKKVKMAGDDEWGQVWSEEE